MARSMTGFGRAVGTVEDERVAIEVSSVNHRFLECSFRIPNAWNAVQPALRQALKRHVARGKLIVAVHRESGPSGRQTVRCDLEVARRYIKAGRELAQLMSTTESLSLNTLAQLDGVFYQQEEEKDIEKVKAALTETLENALIQFNAMRTVEGEALAKDIAERIRQMRDALGAIEGHLPGLAQAYEEHLRARVAELNAEAGLKEERIVIEIALMADKADVHEEVVRLKAHLEYVSDVLGSPEPIGRELNFAAQEIQREANTLGSKLRDIGVTREALRIKSELEKLREQAQNIE